MGSITSAIAEEGVNISDMINKSRGEVAYTLVDTDEAPSQKVIDHLNSLENIVRVTVLG